MEGKDLDDSSHWEKTIHFRNSLSSRDAAAMSPISNLSLYSEKKKVS